MCVWVNVRGTLPRVSLGLRVLGVACALVGCIDDFEHPKGYGSRQRIEPPEPPVEPASCFELCVETGQCPNTGFASPSDCADQCDEIERLVEYAGCEGSFRDYLDCFAAEAACYAPEACDVESQALSQCFASTCERAPKSCGL